MNAWLTVLKQTFLKRRFAPSLIAVWLVATTAMTAALWPECPYPYNSWEGIGWRLPSCLLVILGVVVWGSLLDGLDAQLSPIAVQLVPGLPRAALTVAIVAWLVLATGLALETSVYGVPFPLMFAAVLICLAITVSRRPAARRNAALILLVVVVAPIYGYRPPLPGGPDAAPWMAWIAAVAAMSMGAIFIVTELGKGADAHAVLYGQLLRSPPEPQAQRDQRARWMWDGILKRPTIFRWVFDRSLRAHSPEVRLLNGLGPTFHWSHAAFGGALQALPMCLIMFVASRLLFGRYSGRVQSGVDIVLLNASIMAFFFAIMLADNRMRELWARRKEQALLLIVPSAPTGSDANRWLMQTLVLHHAVAVVAAFWFVTAVAVVLQQPLESTLKAMSAPLAASLLVTPALLRDYASLRQPRRLQYTLYAGISLVPLYSAVILPHGVNPVIVVIVALVLSGILAAWRYARFVEAPTAFPVGRLVD